MSGTLRAALLFAGVAIVTGYRLVDVDSLAQLHANPFQPLEAIRSFLHSSVLNIFVGHAVRAFSPPRIEALYLAATSLALGAVLLHGHRTFADPGQRWTF